MAYLMCRLDWSLQTVIWKDPTACFAAREATDRHQIPVVVTVRPAAAVAASYKRMQWGSGLIKVLASLEQIGIDHSSLMAVYGKHLESHAVGAALLWCVVYRTLLDWAETRPLIRFVNLQDTIDHPIEMYSELYERLGLEWTPAVAEKLRRRYLDQPQVKKKLPEALPQRAHVSGRSLSDVNTYGKKLLTPDELRIIEDMTTELWQRVKAACIPVEPAARCPGSRGSIARCCRSITAAAAWALAADHRRSPPTSGRSCSFPSSPGASVAPSGSSQACCG